MFSLVLRRQLLMKVTPRTATVLTGVVMAALALIGYGVTGSVFGAIVGFVIGALLPGVILRLLRRRRGPSHG